MNNDLISRSTVIDHLKAKVCNDCYVLKSGGKCGGCFIRAALDMIEDVAAVDAEVVRHGRWKVGNSEFGFAEDIDCSECGSMYNFYKKPNYCPNCGAKMDAEVEDDA